MSRKRSKEKGVLAHAEPPRKNLPAEARSLIANASNDITIPYFSGVLQHADDTLIQQGGGKGLAIYDEIERDTHAFSMLQKRRKACRLPRLGGRAGRRPSGRQEGGRSRRGDPEAASLRQDHRGSARCHAEGLRRLGDRMGARRRPDPAAPHRCPQPAPLRLRRGVASAAPDLDGDARRDRTARAEVHRPPCGREGQQPLRAWLSHPALGPSSSSARGSPSGSTSSRNSQGPPSSARRPTAC